MDGCPVGSGGAAEGRAEGDAVVVMDADLQDPPEVVQEMLERWREGYDVVYGQRTSRAGATLFKKVTAADYEAAASATLVVFLAAATEAKNLRTLDTVTGLLLSEFVVVALKRI